MLVPGDFFGEGVLAGNRFASRPRRRCAEQRADDRESGDRPAAPREPRSPTGSCPTCCTRNIRIEADLVDQLFNSSEKRLARTLLLLARYGGRQSHADAAEDSRRRRSPK
jgi:hypothetical protein